MQFYHNRRSELTFKEEQWQKRQESLEKRISELEDFPEKGKKSNLSQRKTLNADKEEITTDMYIIVQRTSMYCTIYFTNTIKD